MESGLRPADPTALSQDSRTRGIVQGNQAQRTRRCRPRAPSSPRRPYPRSPPRPAAGPDSMRRAALCFWLCALALRLQPVLPVSVAGAGLGGGGKPGLADPQMQTAARGGGGEPQT